jgi:hypothetical protein
MQKIVEAVRLFAFVTVLCFVDGHEIVQIAALQGISFQPEVLIPSEIVNPECLRLLVYGVAPAGLRSKNRTIAFTPWRGEDAGR